LTKAEAAGLSLSVEDDELVIEGPQDAEEIAFALLAEKGRVVQALRVLELASHSWETYCVIGGRWADNGPSAKTPGGDWYDLGWRARNGCHRRQLVPGKVEGGSQDRWRAFCDRASMKQLIEAEAIFQSLSSAA
jgi:hypothetical protein